MREEGERARVALSGELEAERAKLDEKLAALDTANTELQACQAGTTEEEPKAVPKPKPKKRRVVKRRVSKPSTNSDTSGLGGSIDDDPIGGL